MNSLMVGIEPTTSRLTAGRSNRLSYTSNIFCFSLYYFLILIYIYLLFITIIINPKTTNITPDMSGIVTSDLRSNIDNNTVNTGAE